MGDQQAPIGETFYIEGASSYKQDSGALKKEQFAFQDIQYVFTKLNLIKMILQYHQIIRRVVVQITLLRVRVPPHYDMSFGEILICISHCLPRCSKWEPRPCCTKLTIDGNFAIKGINYHGNLDFDWLLSPVTMVVAINGKVTINGKFCATGALSDISYIRFLYIFLFYLFQQVMKMTIQRHWVHVSESLCDRFKKRGKLCNNI